MESKLELKHHKDFHKVQFQNLTTIQRNLTLVLCYKLMNQESNLLEFDVKEIIEMTGYKPLKKGDNIYKHLERTYDVLKNITIKIDKNNGVKKFVLFTVFETFEDTGKVKIKVNSEYRYLLNQVTTPFTLQNLIEYSGLKSNYSQLLYSLLKEWEKKKECIFTIEDFRNDLGIPLTYSIDTINKRVFKQIFKDLPPYFPNLKLEKIKTGKKVTSLKFTWTEKQKELLDINTAEVIEIEISEQLNKAIEKAKKNRFIEKFLTLDNIEILTNMFQENDLVKGLIWAYKEVKQDISTLNYLIKTIRTGAEKKEIKIKVKKEKIQEIKQESLFDENPPVIEKIDITQKDLNKKYQEYLKEIGLSDNLFLRKGFESKYNVLEEKNIQDTKIFTEKDIPEEKLLGKNGRKLVGAALQMRIRKILESQ